jgi:hypothetical protein
MNEVPAPIAGLLEGTPAALSVPPVSGLSDDPDVAFVQKQWADLLEAGIATYEAQSTGDTVLYNPKGGVTEEALAEADAAGRLYEIAPPLGTPVQPAAEGPVDVPIEAEQPQAQAMPQAVPQPGPRMDRLAKTRAQNASPKAPSQRPRGRLDDLEIRAI